MSDEDRRFPQGRAMALLAHALDMGSPGAIDRRLLDQLLEEVCDDEGERSRLVSSLSLSQNAELPALMQDLIGARLDRQREALERAEDMDLIYGLWGQRLAGGALLASLGFLATGVMGPLAGGLSLAAALAAAAVTSLGRARIRAEGRRCRRAVERTERLLGLLARSGG